MKKWIQRLIPLFLTLGVILLKTETTQAAERSKDEANPDGSETLVIGLDDTFAPMGFRNEQGELVGFDIDLSASSKDITVTFSGISSKLPSIIANLDSL